MCKRNQFEDFFNLKILDLLHSYPEKYISESGFPFLSGHKRIPSPLVYDPNNEYHSSFIIYGSKILSIPEQDNAHLLAAKFPSPEWNPFVRKFHLRIIDLKRQV
jgi:hypothetical protein